MMNRRTSIAALFTALLVLAAGCNDSAGPVDPADLVFAPALGVDLAAMTRTSSGLYFKDETVGAGTTAGPGNRVTVDYSGWLHTGLLFDSSAGRTPLVIPSLGARYVIPGWDEGLVGMKVGGRRLLVIPSSLGYGATGSGGIPPHATLVFRVDLRGVN